MATPSRGAVLLAVAAPLVLFHVDYQPGFAIGSGAADVDVLLSDLVIGVLAVVLVARIAGNGVGSFRPGLAIWTLTGGLLAWIAAATVHGALSGPDYSFAQHLVTAAKFAEYAVLAVAVPVLARTRRELELVLGSIAVWAGLASVVGLAQFVGVDVFDAWPAGRRQPSFLGHHDFAALSASGFAVGLAALVFGKRKQLPVAACTAGALGLVVSGSVAGLLGMGAALGMAGLVAVKRRAGVNAVAATGAGVLITAALLVTLRGNDLNKFLQFTGVRDDTAQTQTGGVETYSHRTLLAYLGLRVWQDHVVLGAGWQASGEYSLVSRYLPDARERFPALPAEAFPAPGRRYGVQNAWVQALADLGAVGFLLLASLIASGIWLGLRGALTGAWPGLAAAGLLLVCAANWTAQGLVAGLAVDSLTWLGLGIAARGVSRD